MLAGAVRWVVYAWQQFASEAWVGGAQSLLMSCAGADGPPLPCAVPRHGS